MFTINSKLLNVPGASPVAGGSGRCEAAQQRSTDWSLVPTRLHTGCTTSLLGLLSGLAAACLLASNPFACCTMKTLLKAQRACL